MADVVYRDTPFWAVISADGLRIVVASIELPSLAAAGADLDLVESYGRLTLSGAGPLEAMMATGRSLGDAVGAAIATLGVDGPIVADAALTASQARAIERVLGREVACCSGPFERARARKDDDAIANLERANRLAETAIAEALSEARTGTTERQLGRRILERIVAGGGLPTLHVVGIGERSALPEAWPTDRAMSAGELIRFDVGCTFAGWHADIARTAVCGEPDAWTEQTYAAILAGQDAALAATVPGVGVADLHALATTATRGAGLTHFDRHHCGHGIGLSVYEGFTVAAEDGTVLDEGNTLCVETPHYDLVRGGVQVEDAIVVTPGGCRRLGVLDRGLMCVAP